MKQKKLFQGETFESKEVKEKEIEQISDKEINEKYRKGEMRIVTEQGRMNLDSIVNLLESKQNGTKKYMLNPDYQRRQRWTIKQKSLLIESFIINVPIPPIFLYEVKYAVYEVMDGLQRLTAIYDFYKEKFALSGLEYWKELNGKKYSELPENVKAGIDRRHLSSIILLEETAKSSTEAEYLKQIVFERLNSGGEKLQAQETRNALYNGAFNQICIELAENARFRSMWNFPSDEETESLLLTDEEDLKNTPYTANDIKSYRKMKDIELVLRFFAYRHVEKMPTSLQPFLDNYLKQANEYPSTTIDKLKQLFVETIDLIFNILGEKAFTLPENEKGRRHNSPTSTIYDSIMQAFAMNITHKDVLLKNKEKIKSKLYSDPTDLIRPDKDKEINLFDGRYNGRGDVISRIEYYNNFLQAFIK